MVTVKELLVEEEATIDAIHQLKEQISVAEMEKEELEFNLWTQTNFSKEGLSNADQRKAFVKFHMSLKNKELASLKNDLLFSENHLKMIKQKERFILEFGVDVLE